MEIIIFTLFCVVWIQSDTVSHMITENEKEHEWTTAFHLWMDSQRLSTISRTATPKITTFVNNYEICLR